MIEALVIAGLFDRKKIFRTRDDAENFGIARGKVAKRANWIFAFEASAFRAVFQIFLSILNRLAHFGKLFIRPFQRWKAKRSALLLPTPGSFLSKAINLRRWSGYLIARHFGSQILLF